MLENDDIPTELVGDAGGRENEVSVPIMVVAVLVSVVSCPSGNADVIVTVKVEVKTEGSDAAGGMLIEDVAGVVETTTVLEVETEISGVEVRMVVGGVICEPPLRPHLRLAYLLQHRFLQS